jgi:hypothetical protein
MFSLNDLFFVGIALDLTGTVFLAFGLLASAASIKALGSPSMRQMDEGTIEERIAGRADAEAGLVVLAMGFASQGIGYLLELAGHEVHAGDSRVLVALAMAAITVAIVLLARGIVRPARIAAIRARVEESEPRGG